MVLNKAEARIAGARVRSELSPGFIERAAKDTLIHLQTCIDWSEIESVHCYRQIESSNEMPTNLFFDWLEKQHPSVKIFAQSKKPEFPDQTFDLVIVPCLAIDQYGHRVGYGKGGYDRFLATQPKDTVVVALCFEDQIYDEIEFEEHDISPSMIITDKQVHKLS